MSNLSESTIEKGGWITRQAWYPGFVVIAVAFSAVSFNSELVRVLITGEIPRGYSDF